MKEKPICHKYADRIPDSDTSACDGLACRRIHECMRYIQDHPTGIAGIKELTWRFRHISRGVPKEDETGRGQTHDRRGAWDDDIGDSLTSRLPEPQPLRIGLHEAVRTRTFAVQETRYRPHAGSDRQAVMAHTTCI